MTRDTDPESDDYPVERREYMLGLGALALPAAASTEQSSWSFLPWVDDQEPDGLSVTDDGNDVLSDLLDDADGIDYGNNLKAKLEDGTLMVEAANASVSGAPADASYVTTSSESGLDNESVHSDLSGTDLHAPKSHGNEAHSSTYIDGVDVQDDGSAVAKATTIDAGTNISASDQGSGTVKLDASGGGLTQVASGTTTVQDQTVNEFVDIPTDGHYIVRGYPSSYDTSSDLAQGFNSGGDSIWIEYAAAGDYADISSDQWVVKINETGNTSMTVEWAVYEL